jgi:uncharacterized protein
MQMQHGDVNFDSGGLQCTATVYRPSGATGVVGCLVMGNGITLTRNDGIPDYAQRFAGAGFAVLAFDYRHWGDSGGEPRRLVSLRRQLEDWEAAVQYARGLEGVDPERVALWGMSLGGGLALMTAAADPRIAATVALVPMADGLAAVAQPAPPGVTARLTSSLTRRALTRTPVTILVAGAPGSFAVIAAPEALPGVRATGVGERLAQRGQRRWVTDPVRQVPARPTRSSNPRTGARPARRARRNGPAPSDRKGQRRAPNGELVRYPIDHFGCFWPEHIEHVAGDQLEFLHRHLRTPKTHHTQAGASGHDTHRTSHRSVVAHTPSRA